MDAVSSFASVSLAGHYVATRVPQTLKSLSLMLSSYPTLMIIFV